MGGSAQLPHGLISNHHPCRVAMNGAFKIDDELTKVSELSKSALNHPELGHRHKPTSGTKRPAGHVMQQVKAQYVLCKLPTVSFVGQHQMQPIGSDRTHVHASNTLHAVAQHLGCSAVNALVRIKIPLLTQARSRLNALRVDQGQQRGGRAMMRQAVGTVAGFVKVV